LFDARTPGPAVDNARLVTRAGHCVASPSMT
jgi:hypothetical protein